MDKKKLGRGLDALLGKQPPAVPLPMPEPPYTAPATPAVQTTQTAAPQPTIPEDSAIFHIDINNIVANKYQPRLTFNEEELKTLRNSIAEEGIIQPVIVRKRDDNKFELIAGERRFKAVKELGYATIPAIVKNVDDTKALTLALVENLHRKDLNSIEKAKGFKQLQIDFSLTQEEIAKHIGMDRSSIANFIRLLDLPLSVQELVSRETISYGHARTLLTLSSEAEQIGFCNKIINEGLSVRQLEEMLKPKNALDGKWRTKKIKTKNAQIQELENKLREYLGTKVIIDHRKKRGTIKIEYYSNEDFDRLFALITGKDLE